MSGGAIDTDFTDTLFSDGTQGELIIGTTAVEIMVSADSKEGRQVVLLQPRDKGIYIGFDSTVTTGTGVEIFKNQIIPIPVGESATLYAIGTGAGLRLRVLEGG